MTSSLESFLDESIDTPDSGHRSTELLLDEWPTSTCQSFHLSHRDLALEG